MKVERDTYLNLSLRFVVSLQSKIAVAEAEVVAHDSLMRLLRRDKVLSHREVDVVFYLLEVVAAAAAAVVVAAEADRVLCCCIP